MSTAASTPNHKYRPILTGKEVQVLARVLRQSYMDNLAKQPYHPDFPNDPDRGFDQVTIDYLVQLMAKMATLETKIANNAIKPSYQSKPPADVFSDLGFAEASPTALSSRVSKEEYWAECYQKYCKSRISCTIPELEAAQEHRYLNDLMTPSELEVFEAKTLGDL